MIRETRAVSISSRLALYRTEVRPSDLEAVERIVRSSGFFSLEEVEVAVELVEERLRHGSRSGYHFLFVEFEGSVIAYSCFGPIACTRSSFDLYWIAAQDDFRGKGYGKELLRRSERCIADLGGTRIYIETSSRRLYESTRLFYLGCGYHEEGILKDFYALGDDKIVYLKVLG